VVYKKGQKLLSLCAHSSLTAHSFQGLLFYFDVREMGPISNPWEEGKTKARKTNKNNLKSYKLQAKLESNKKYSPIFFLLKDGMPYISQKHHMQS
jgi:hypothetical protein